jgi:hypothetical protein
MRFSRARARARPSASANFALSGGTSRSPAASKQRAEPRALRTRESALTTCGRSAAGHSHISHSPELFPTSHKSRRSRRLARLQHIVAQFSCVRHAFLRTEFLVTCSQGRDALPWEFPMGDVIGMIQLYILAAFVVLVIWVAYAAIRFVRNRLRSPSGRD